MSYMVAIKCNDTGEVQITHHEFEFNSRMWTDGNYCCDCNRELFFMRNKFPDEDNDEWGKNCGDNKYSIEYIEVDGIRYKLEDAPESY